VTYYIVPVEGDPDLARGLLARSGIQHVMPEPGRVSARLSAARAEIARGRVVGALADAEFSVGEAVEESLGLPRPNPAGVRTRYQPAARAFGASPDRG
jgi:hypothetical protein